MAESIISSLRSIERKLGIQLPACYLAAIERLSKLDDPDKMLGVIVDPQRLLEVNLAIRENPKKYVENPASLAKNWPNNYFVISSGIGLCFFDAQKKNPEVQSIYERKLVPKDHLTSEYFKSLTAFLRSREKSVKVYYKSVKHQQLLELEREKAANRRVKKVECPDLVADGHRMAKECWLLGPSGSKLIGIKGGEPIGCPPKKLIAHMLTVSCSAFPLNPRLLTGIISIYRVEHEDMYKIVYDPNGRLPRRSSGTRLYGTKYSCLPCFGVLVHKGSQSTKKWFRSLRVSGRDAEGWSTSKQGTEHPEVNRYVQAFYANHPFYRFQPGEYSGMVGGWSLDYPGGSHWYETMNRQLLLATLQDEPWFEVLDGTKSPKLFWHIT